MNIDQKFKSLIPAPTDDDEENNDRIFGFNGDSGKLNSEEKENVKAFLKFLHSQNKKLCRR